ncbi:MAG: hypothetical protein QXN71_00240 [Candidatus Aenigmatarchaeota archaeon]
MKAQIWSMDFGASLLIFISAMVILLFAWSYVMQQNQQQILLNSMESTAMGISDSLVRQPGIPNEWNETTVETIGLAVRENVLNETKVGYFVNMDSETIKTILGISGYNFYFEIRYSNGTLAEVPGGSKAVTGNYPPQSASFSVPSERYVIYDEKPARLKFILWV